MKCPECGLEMIIWEKGEYVCRNPKCGRFEPGLRKPKEEKPKE